MGLTIFLALISLPPFELIPDWQITPDDEEVYQLVEDSLFDLERFSLQTPIRSHFLLRLRSDSIPEGFAEPAGFLRLNLLRRNQEACVIIEKDAGEKQFADFWGGGLTLKTRGWRLTFGDYLLHFGRGLIFSSPYARSGFTETGLGQSENVLARSAQENRNLRGFRIDRGSQRFRFSFVGSYSLRDATVNPDGTIARLRFSGMHRDSVSLREKGKATQMLAGSIAQMQVSERLSAGLAIQGIRFNRRFAPEDSVYSFSGQNLGAVSLFLKAGVRSRSGEVEIASSGFGAIAASARVAVNEAGVNAAIAGSVYAARFFSPAGRAYALGRRLSRAEVNARVGYQQAGFFAAIEGNTHRDYLTDSIPGRLQFRTGYESKPVHVRFILGKRFDAEDERSRNSRIEIDTGWRVLTMRLTLGDEYCEGSSSRGRVAGLNIRSEIKSVDICFTGTLIDILGNGMRISAPESDVMRLGAVFSSKESAQRLSIAAAVKMKGLGRIGAKLALTHKEDWQPDFAMQAEVIN